MIYFEVVETVEDFRTLDEGEMLCGYMDGMQGLPCPLAKVTRSFWHGWRNGAFDGGFVDRDEASDRLEADFLLLRDA